MNRSQRKVMDPLPEFCDVIMISDAGYHLRELFVGPPLLHVVVEGARDRSDLKGQISWLLSAGRHG